MLSFITNLVIAAGYFGIPVTWLPYMRLNRPMLATGMVFFLTCALTHLAMAFGLEHTWWMTVVHVIQAVSVVAFVWRLSGLMRRADRALRRAEQEHLQP